MKCSFGIPNFLEAISSLSHVLFSSISLHCSLRKSFLSLIAILCKSAFRWVYLSFSLYPFTSLLYSAICKASSENHFAFLHFFSLGMVLIIVSHKMLHWAICLSDLMPWIYLSLPLYNRKGYDLGHTWMASLVAPAMQKTCVRSPSQEDPLEKEMAIYSSILAWKIPWLDEPDRLQSMGSQRVRHD